MAMRIETEAQYKAALVRAEILMDGEPGAPEKWALERLVLVIEEYEKIHFPITPPTPAEAIKFRMEQEDSQGKAKLIAEVGVHLYGVSPLLALEIAKLVKQEREENLALGETTLTIGSSEDTPDGYIHTDDEVYLAGPIGINITPQADLHVVGVVHNGDVLNDNQRSLLALPLLDRFLGKTVEVTVRVLVDGAHGDSIIVDEATEMGEK